MPKYGIRMFMTTSKSAIDMKKLLTLSLVGAAALVASSSSMFAQRDTCRIVNGVKCYVQYDANNNVIFTDCPPEDPGGEGVFDEVQPIPDQGPVNATLEPVAVTASFNIAQLGKVDVALDQTAPQPTTTITSVNPDARYPLSVNITFNAQATVSSEPDRRYVSATPLVFNNDNVNSVKPFRNETFTLASDVNFVRPESPDHVEFTLQAGTSFLTLGGNDGADGGGVGTPGDPGVH